MRAGVTLAGLAAFIILTHHVHAQGSIDTLRRVERTERRAPGPEYASGGFHRLLFGDAWRDLWTTPIDVEVIDLATFAGGLTATKQGGGFQTKSLRLRGADGREYKFRSLNKDPKKLLPEELRKTFVADIVQEFIATSNPLSALVAVPIINAAGVINAEPRLVILPDDERLGEFRAEFGGLLGTLEVNPEAGDETEQDFAGAEKIASTITLFKRLEKDNDERVDARGYLTARLVDIYLGDWDRHVDQWRWARFDEEEKVWRPIPRDRDQAFCRYEGLVPSLAEYYVEQIEGCEPEYPSIADLTWSGRHIDRRFLASLEKPVWDSIARALHARLTDSLISYAVHRLPPQMYTIEGAELERTLRSRRDRFLDAADEYYHLLAGIVDIHGSDKAEYLEIVRVDDDRTDVTLYDLDKERAIKGAPLLRRTLRNEETDELRIDLLGGDDSVVVRGHVARSPLVRLIGGDGNDRLYDSSTVDGWLLGLLPIPDAETSTRFYDSDEGIYREGPSTSIDRRKVKAPKDDAERYEPPVRDRGAEVLPIPWFNVSPNEGLFIGGGALITEFGFRANPYVDRMEIKAGFAAGARRFKVAFNGDFRKAIDGARLGVRAFVSGIEVLNYFGAGNETSRSKELVERGFYTVEQEQYLLDATLGIPLLARTELLIGVEGKYTSTELDDSTLLASLRPLGSSNELLASGIVGLRIDTRDNEGAPVEGVYLDLRGAHYPKLSAASSAFTRASIDLRCYINTHVLTEGTLALRAAGSKIWGAHPYYESAFLGGLGTIRGFDKERFAGDASALGSAELRLHVAKINLLLPFSLGVHGFSDFGRVFVGGESSRLLHRSFGGGIWLSFLEPANTLSISIARSDERVGVYVVGGFAF